MNGVEFIGTYNIRTKYAPRAVSFLKRVNEILEWETVSHLEDIDFLIETLPDELIEEKNNLETLYDNNCSDYSSVVRSSDGLHVCNSPVSFGESGKYGRPNDKIVHVCGMELTFCFYHDGCPSGVYEK